MADTPDIYSLPLDSTLIVGAGIAGLFTALKMAPKPVTIITAAPMGRGGSSNWAQGGLAAAIGEDDSPELHFQDTVNAGAGLVDEPAARILTTEGPARVENLLALGVEFDRGRDGNLKLGREAAHTRNRIVHASGDQAGAAIMATLTEAALKANHITIRERIVAESILLDEHGNAAGILAIDIVSQKRIQLLCPRTVLATGGLGGLYAVTTNPVRAQGHGIAMAYRAGAEIMDPEFIQFHPTALDVGVDPAPLATEALRGEGAWLVDNHGTRILEDIHPDLELAPRDIVARTVAASIAEGQGAFLDARQAIGDKFADTFPTVYRACRNASLDPVAEPIPIAPAAHYHMGGIRTDTNGKSTVKGLWAVGEVANTGIHGANRLASNSLLEALVFGNRTAQSLKSDSRVLDQTKVKVPEARLALPPKPASDDDMRPLRRLMAEQAGLIRKRDHLGEALDFVYDKLTSADRTSGYDNALTTTSLILEAAHRRRESRGSHYRTDYPDRDTALHGLLWLNPVSQKPEYRTDPVLTSSTRREPA